MYDLLRKKLGGVQDDATDFARRLIRIPSPSGHEGAVARILAKELEKTGYDEVFTDKAGNVVGIIRGRGEGPTIGLFSHMDTAVVGEDSQWTFEPCSGAIDGENLCGRGAADCKGGIAAQVYAGLLIKRAMLPLRGDLVVASVVSEEAGGNAGLRILFETLKQRGIKIDVALLADPTDLNLYVGHDGWLDMEVIVNPRQAREPADMDMLSGRVGRLGDTRIRGLRTENASAGGGARFNFEWHEDPDDIDTVVNSVRRTFAEASESNGVATALLVRPQVVMEKTYTGATTLVEKRVKAWTSDILNPRVQTVRRSYAAAAMPAKIGRWNLPYPGMATGGSYICGELGIPTIGIGPGKEEDAHSVNEKVSAGSVTKAVYGIAAVVHGTIGAPVYGWSSEDI